MDKLISLLEYFPEKYRFPMALLIILLIILVFIHKQIASLFTWVKGAIKGNAYDKDKERFEYALSIIPQAEFKSLILEASFTALPEIWHKPFGICIDKYNYMKDVKYPNYIEKKLAKREKVFFEALKKFTHELDTRLVFKNSSVRTLTIKNIDHNNRNEDLKELKKIEEEIDALAHDVDTAFVDFRDFGNRLFAKKMVEAKE